MLIIENYSEHQAYIKTVMLFSSAQVVNGNSGIVWKSVFSKVVLSKTFFGK